MATGNPFDDLVPRQDAVQNVSGDPVAVPLPGTLVDPAATATEALSPPAVRPEPVRQPLPGTVVFGNDLPRTPVPAPPPPSGIAPTSSAEPRTPTSMFEKLGVPQFGAGVGGSYEAIGQGLQQLAEGPTVPATVERAEVFQDRPSRLGTVRPAGTGVADTGRAIAEYGKGIREAQPPMAVPTYQDVKTWGDLGTYIWESVQQAAGSTVPMLAAGAVVGPAGAVGSGWLMGVGQMRKSVEDERLKVDKAAQAAAASGNADEYARLTAIAARLDPKTQAQVIYATGSVIGALDSLFPASLLANASEAALVKQLTAEYVTKAITAAAMRGAATEGVTETLQQGAEVLGIAKAKGAAAAADYAKALNDNAVEIIDAGLRGAIGGGGMSGAGRAGSLAGERDREQPTPGTPQQPQERQEPQLPWLPPEAVAAPPEPPPAAPQASPPKRQRRAAAPATPANPFADLVPANQNDAQPEGVTPVAAATPEAPPTAPAGAEPVTLYRGEAPGAESDPMRPARAGQNWTTSLENAQAYAGEGGNVYSVTVPADRINGQDIQKSEIRPDELRLPPDLADRSRWQPVAAGPGTEPVSQPAAPSAPRPGTTPAAPLAPPMRVVTPDGSMEIEAVPEIVELADLKRAEGALQPRDRSRAEYAQETRERAANLDPMRLQPSRTSDTGAPIVAADGTVLSGNGRTMSIEQAYRDRTLAGIADTYRRSLGKAAEGMREPVLIMRATNLAPEQATRFADLSNRTVIAQMSATERAQRDAQAVGLAGIALYEGGDFNAPQNQRFLRDFMTRAVTAAEMPSVSRDNQLTLEGIARMRAAVLAAAYGDADVLSRMLESTDDNVRAITSGMLDAAPKMAHLRAGIASGDVDPGMDPTSALIEAINTIATLRARKESVQQWLAQTDAFGRDPVIEAWVKSFYYDDAKANAAGARRHQEKVAQLLNDYVDEAVLHRPDGLFADETTTADVLRVAMRKNDDQNQDVAAPAGSVGESVPKGRKGAAGRPDGAGRKRSGEGDDVLAAIQSAPSQLDRVARAILRDARTFEEGLRAEGATPQQIADAVNRRYQSAVTAEQVESGNVWWRRMSGETEASDLVDRSNVDLGVSPELADALLTQNPMTEGQAAPIDLNAKPAQPQRTQGVEGGASPGPRLTAEQREAALSLAQQGLDSVRIAQELQSQFGTYVRPDLVDSVVTRAKTDREQAAGRERSAKQAAERRRAFYESPENRESKSAMMREIMARPEMQEWLQERGRQLAASKGQTVWSPGMVEALGRPEMRTMTAQQAADALKAEFGEAAAKLTPNAVRQKRSDLGYGYAGDKFFAASPFTPEMEARLATPEYRKMTALKAAQSLKAEFGEAASRVTPTSILNKRAGNPDLQASFKGGVPDGKFGWSPEADKRLADLMVSARNPAERAAALNKEFGGPGIPALTPKAVSKRWDKIKDSVLRAQGEEPMFAIGGWDPRSWLDWIKGNPDVGREDATAGSRTGEEGSREPSRRQSSPAGVGREGAGQDAGGGADGVRQSFRVRDLLGRVVDAPPNGSGLRQQYLFLHPPKVTWPFVKDAATTLRNLDHGVPNWVAKAHVSEVEPGVWQVMSVKVRRKQAADGLTPEFLDALQGELGDVRPPDQMPAEAYQAWRNWERQGSRWATSSVDGYVEYKGGYYSPGMLRLMQEAARDVATSDPDVETRNKARRDYNELSDLVDKLPLEDDGPLFAVGASPAPAPGKEFWDAVKPLDAQASGEFGKALDRWVGGPHDAAEMGQEFGLMIPGPLEGMSAAELEKAAKPVRDMLRERYGDTITVYRGEGGGGQSTGRQNRLFSYTTDRRIAERFAGAGREAKVFSEDEINAAERQFAETGEATLGRIIFRRDPEWGSIDMFNRGGEHITDTPSIRAWAEGENADANERNAQRQQAMSRVREIALPVDDVIWATDRFNQREIIAKPRLVAPEAPADLDSYINETDYNRLIRDAYIDRATGEVKASSRQVPVTAELPPVGSWRISNLKGIYGREIEHLTTVPLADLQLPELDSAGKLDPIKRGDDERYAGWLKEGRRAPPIEIVQTERGNLRVMDGHRRALAAKRAGKSEIEAWVSYAVPTGKVGSDGRPIMTGLTYEMANPEGQEFLAAAGASPGLDMSPEAKKQRLQEMGFDTSRVYYHGSPDFRGVKSAGAFESRTTNRHNRKTGEWEKAPQAIYFTPDRPMAATYADDRRAFDYQNAEPEIFPSHLKLGRVLDIDAGGQKFSTLDRSIVKMQIPQAQWAEFDRILDTYGNSTDGKTIRTGDLELLAPMLGYDSFRLRNVKDAYDGTGKPGTVVAVFDPRNIRSVNATGDPAQESSANLMAAVNGEPRNLRAAALKGVTLFKRPVVIPESVVDGVRRAIEPLMPMVPAGTGVGIMTRIEPVKGGRPGENAEITFETADGDTFGIRGDAIQLLGMRALFDPNTNSIGLIRFDLSGDIGQMLGRIDRGEIGDVVVGDRAGAKMAPASLRGEIGHEVVHALRRNRLIRDNVWSRLVAQGNALRVLDSEYRTLLQRIGNANYTTMPAGVTGREVYLESYRGRDRANQQERLDQETVAHLLELYTANDLLPMEVEPVRDILDAILDGSIWQGEQGQAQGELALEPMAAAQTDKREAQALSLGHLPDTFYHGTTRKIKPKEGFYDPRRDSGANPYESESHHGRAIYMSSSRSDSEGNYAGHGPDLKNRISRIAEQTEWEMKDVDKRERAALERYAKKLDGLVENGELDADYYLSRSSDDMRLAYAKAHRDLYGGKPNTMELRTNPRNPVILGNSPYGKETFFEFGQRRYGVEQDGDQWVVKDPDGDEESRFDDEAEAYDRADTLTYEQEPSGPAARILEKLRMAGLDETAGHLSERAMDTDGFTASELENAIRNGDDAVRLIDDNVSPGQFLQDIYVDLGHDGVILSNAEDQFKGMNIPPDTTHIALFDNRRVRSTKAKFDPKRVDETDLLAATQRQRLRDQDRLGYYSKLDEVLSSLGPKDKVTAATLQAKGVKLAEIEARGLKNLLADGAAVPVADLVETAGRNRVELRESARYKTPPADIQSRPNPDDASLTDVFVNGEQAAQIYRDGDRYVIEMEDGDKAQAATFEQAMEYVRRNDAGLTNQTKWSSYSLDPSNPTYRETVLHLPPNFGEWQVEHRPQLNEYVLRSATTDELMTRPGGSTAVFKSANEAEAAASRGGFEKSFKSGHFPEPNIIGHMMTSMVKHEGKPVYLIDQIQSDWGQKLRDGGVRDEAKIAELEKRYEEANRDKLNAYRDADQWARGFLGKGDALTLASYAYGDGQRDVVKRLVDVRKQFPDQEAQVHRWIETTSKANDAHQLVGAELRTAEAATPGNPLVNTTDQWVNTTLRRAIRQAAEADADYIAIPSGDTVLSYNPGDDHGMESFYGALPNPRGAASLRKEIADVEAGRNTNLDLDYLKKRLAIAEKGIEGIVPKNLRNLLQKIDKASPAPTKVEKLETPTSGMKGSGFTLFPLTDRVKQAVLDDGQPLFAFGGINARTADKEALARAEAMEAAGASREDIWSQTGWFRGPVDQETGRGGEWRFEIDDSGSTFNRSAMKPVEYRILGNSMIALTGRTGDVMAGSDLLSAYPKLADITTVQGRGRDFYGQFSGSFNEGRISPSISLNLDNLPDDAQARSTMLHELQHGIQDIEGTARGGSARYVGKVANPAVPVFERAMREDPRLQEFSAIRASAEYQKEMDANNQRYNDIHKPVLDALEAEESEIRKTFGRRSPEVREIRTRIDQFFKDVDADSNRRFPLINRVRELDEELRRDRVPRWRPAEFLEPQEAYVHLAGEVEARAVQKRMDMTAEERRARPPWLDYDVPEDQQIVRFDDSGPSYSFGTILSPDANITAYTEAVVMAKRGASPRDIWDATGWFKDKTGKWRFEKEVPEGVQTVADARAHAQRMQMTPEQRRATPPWEPVAEEEDIFARARRIYSNAEATVRAELQKPNPRLTATKNGVTAVLTRSMDGSDGFRITSFSNNEPIGHRDYSNDDRGIKLAAQDMVSQGLKPDEPKKAVARASGGRISVPKVDQSYLDRALAIIRRAKMH